MVRAGFIVCASLLLAAACFSQAISQNSGLAPSGWSKFLANASNCPQGTQPAAKGKIAMTIDVFPGPMSKPAIAPDGTVYIIEQEADSRLRAMTPAGATKWIVDVPGEAQTTRRAPVIGPNGTIYAYTYGVLYAVSPEGKLLWKFPAQSDAAVDRSGVVYVGGSGQNPGSVTALNSDGSTKWKTSVPGADRPTVGPSGDIYVGSKVGLTKLSSNGAILWSKPLPWPLPGAETFCLADGSVCVWNGYFASSLVANFTAAGALRWSYTNFGEGPWVIGYGANPRGGMYVLMAGGTLTCLGIDGTKTWSRELTMDPLRVDPATEVLTVDSGGTVYAEDSQMLWAVAGDDRTHWSCQLGDGGYGSVAISTGGSIYVSSQFELSTSASTKSLYAVSSAGKVQWGRYGSLASVPSFGADGTAYFAGGYGITAYDSKGNFKWTRGDGKDGAPFPPSIYGNQWPAMSQPTVASDGTIYYWAQDGFRAVTPAGKLKWVYPYLQTRTTFGQPIMPAIGPDGTVYFADRNLYALNPDGTLKWSKTYADWMAAVCPAISADGTIYVITVGELNPQAVYAIAPDGTVNWSSVQVNPWQTMSLDAKGNLYTIIWNQMVKLGPTGGQTNTIGPCTSAWFVVASDGTVCYRDSTTNNIVLNGGTPMGSDWDPFAMASDLTIYGVTETGGTLRAYSPNGKLLWSLPGIADWFPGEGVYANGSADRPFSIAANGSLYVVNGYGFTVVN